MTFIGLEGCDGAGKSTLAEAVISELQARFPNDTVEYIHRSQLERDPVDEYALDIEKYRPGSNHHIVADRWHWGETIYGPLYRNGSALSEGAFRWVEMFMKARGVTFWHVTAPLNVIRERLESRGEDYLETHHVEHVWEGFSHAASKSMLTGGTADTGKYSPETLARLIVQESVYQESQAIEFFRPEYIGVGLPMAILVGDKQGNSEPGVTQAPFMARGKSSGTYLLESLQPRWWPNIGIVNANETDLKQLLDSLFNPPVVALGMNASEALDDLDIDHAIAPHPQKIRRFHHKRQIEYGLLLKELSEQGGNKLTWPS